MRPLLAEGRALQSLHRQPLNDRQGQGRLSLVSVSQVIRQPVGLAGEA